MSTNICVTHALKINSEFWLRRSLLSLWVGPSFMVGEGQFGNKLHTEFVKQTKDSSEFASLSSFFFLSS